MRVFGSVGRLVAHKNDAALVQPPANISRQSGRRLPAFCGGGVAELRPGRAKCSLNKFIGYSSSPSMALIQIRNGDLESS